MSDVVPNTANDLADIRRGEEAAFMRLVGRYQPRVEAWLSLRLGAARTGLNQVEDLAQSVLFSVWQEVSNKRTWVADVATSDDLRHLLFRLITLRVADAKRFEGRARRVGTIRIDAVPEGTPAADLWEDKRADGCPADNGLLAETLREINAKLARDVDDGVCLFEDWLHGRSVKESAARLGIGERSVARRRSDIRAILRAWYRDDIAGCEGGVS